MQKKMFKVISPVDKGNGSTWWMRCGSAFMNADDSINIYLEALPLIPSSKGNGVKLQLREYTAEEMRERAERRSTYSMRNTPRDPNGLPTMGEPIELPTRFDPSAVPARNTNETADVPF